MDVGSEIEDGDEGVAEPASDAPHAEPVRAVKLIETVAERVRAGTSVEQADERAEDTEDDPGEGLNAPSLRTAGGSVRIAPAEEGRGVVPVETELTDLAVGTEVRELQEAFDARLGMVSAELGVVREKVESTAEELRGALRAVESLGEHDAVSPGDLERRLGELVDRQAKRMVAAEQRLQVRLEEAEGRLRAKLTEAERRHRDEFGELEARAAETSTKQLKRTLRAEFASRDEQLKELTESMEAVEGTAATSVQMLESFDERLEAVVGGVAKLSDLQATISEDLSEELLTVQKIQDGSHSELGQRLNAEASAREQQMERLRTEIGALRGEPDEAIEQLEKRLTGALEGLGRLSDLQARASEDLDDRLTAGERRQRGHTDEIERRIRAEVDERVEAFAYDLRARVAELEAAVGATEEGKQVKERAQKYGLNGLSFEGLRELGLSATQAVRVVAWREALRGFTDPEQIDDVPGLPDDQRDLLKRTMQASSE